MSNAFLYRMPSGIPGAISRESVATIEYQPLDSTKNFGEYGLAGQISGDNFVPITSGSAITAVYGFLVRPYPTTGANASDPLGTAVPPTSGEANVLKRGYISVKCYRGTPAKNGTVYIRVGDTDTTGFPLGSITADADSTTAADTLALPGAYFTGAGDANGNVEVAYNL